MLFTPLYARSPLGGWGSSNDNNDRTSLDKAFLFWHFPCLFFSVRTESGFSSLSSLGLCV